MCLQAMELILVSGYAHEALTLCCPQCHMGIRVAYTPGRRASVGAVCPSCLWSIQLDGIASEPKWVRELGSAFETHK
jgi:hypothetical protein